MAWLGAVLVAGLGIFWVVRRRHMYPGGWAFAFSLRYEGDREALAKARALSQDRARRAAQEEAAAQDALASAEAGHERRLRALEHKIAGLRSPGSGARIDGLGELVLFTHLVMVRSDTTTHPIELAGLDARFELGQQNYSVYLTDAAGHVHRAKYPHRPAPDALLAERFDEDRVRDFVVAIQNAAARENSFRARIPEQLQTFESELAAARADTSVQDAARERLGAVRERNSGDPHRKAADAALGDALKAWEELTGHRPPKHPLSLGGIFIGSP
ncbi:hypothetical protein [Streptomyces sp. NPDC051014]|uniref:hypothetical protein n=1 Tax=Streptomyces sp. NPDC051014 TaxID=3155751 RepID=UPI0033C8866A